MDIYVGNIHHGLEEESLEKLFGVFGDVLKAIIINDKETGNSRGFGFVTMANATEAQRAIDEMNGRLVAGRNLVVKEAVVKEQQPKPVQRDNYYEDLLYKETPNKINDLDMEVVDEAKFTATKGDDGYVSIKFS